MNIDLSEEQILLRESVERTATRYASASDVYDPAIWKALVNLGMAGLLVEQDQGGLGGSAVDLSIVMECLGRRRVLCPMVSSGVVAASLIADLAESHCKSQLLGRIADGQLIIATALPTEASRGASGRLEATSTSDGWRLTGKMSMVHWAPHADIFILGATITSKNKPHEDALFWISSDSEGLTIIPGVSIDGTPVGQIVVDMEADQAACLGIGAPVSAALDKSLDLRDVALMADAVGALDHLVDATAEYCRTRKQFGKPLSEFQALRHRMAEMAVLREEARALLLLASIRATSPPTERRRAVLSARIKIGRASRWISEEAVQLHGAMGVTEELDVGRYLKRLLQFELHDGSTQQHARRLANALKDRPDAITDGLLLPTNN